jgi:hypothetical protein
VERRSVAVAPAPAPDTGGGDTTPEPDPPALAPPPIGAPLPTPGPTAPDDQAAVRRNLARILAALRRAGLRRLARPGRVRVNGLEALRPGRLTVTTTAERVRRARNRAAVAARVTVLRGSVRFTAAGGRGWWCG